MSKTPEYIKQYNKKYYQSKKSNLQEKSKLNAQKKKYCVIFTDGSCINNPGQGGWGALIFFQGEKIKLSGHDENTTNNRMELLAAISAIEYCLNHNIHTKIIIYTDSTYVLKGATLWMTTWKANNWTKPKNKDLWILLDDLISKHNNIEWNWVKAHDGNPDNEEVDQLAKSAIQIIQ